MSDEQVAPTTETATPASEWKRKARALWLLTLPSGNRVKARRIDLSRLLRTGEINLEQVVSIPNLSASLSQDATAAQKAIAALSQVIPLAQRIAALVVVEPRLVAASETLPEDAITFDDMTDYDLLAIFAWARDGVAQSVKAIEIG